LSGEKRQNGKVFKLTKQLFLSIIVHKNGAL
jgi:hypothetical protein